MGIKISAFCFLKTTVLCIIQGTLLVFTVCQEKIMHFKGWKKNSFPGYFLLKLLYMLSMFLDPETVNSEWL